MMSLDWIAGVVAWFGFFIYRKQVESPGTQFSDIFNDPQLILGIVIIPAGWLILWYFLGSYRNVFRKSRIQTLYQTIGGSVLGALFLLFAVIRDDLTLEVISYMTAFLIVLSLHFLCFSIFRIVFLTVTKLMLRKKWVVHKAILFSNRGSGLLTPPRYTQITQELELENWSGEMIADELDTIIIDEYDTQQLNKKLSSVLGVAGNKMVYLSESSFAQLEYDYDAHPRLGEPYIVMKTSPVAQWQLNLKRMMDVTLSTLALFILSPLYLWLSYRVGRSSEGPVIFSQQRIGRNGQNFTIFKFRTMHENAEEQGPALATKNDERCTKIGKWMRRWRLDELPQFYNVLKGDMSLVGPRPERSYYADQLIALNPRYPLLWQVRPGITSWGQIKYGYASTIEEMLRRFRYDLLYLENMSILLDLRILSYTLIVLFQGRGR